MVLTKEYHKKLMLENIECSLSLCHFNFQLKDKASRIYFFKHNSFVVAKNWKTLPCLGQLDGSNERVHFEGRNC